MESLRFSDREETTLSLSCLFLYFSKIKGNEMAMKRKKKTTSMRLYIERTREDMYTLLSSYLFLLFSVSSNQKENNTNKYTSAASSPYIFWIVNRSGRARLLFTLHQPHLLRSTVFFFFLSFLYYYCYYYVLLNSNDGLLLLARQAVRAGQQQTFAIYNNDFIDDWYYWTKKGKKKKQ